MASIPIKDVAEKLRRTESWVASELHAAGIRSTNHIYSLSIEELEKLVEHLRSKWKRQNETTAKSSRESRANEGSHNSQAIKAPPRPDKLSFSPAEQREIALALLDLPDKLRPALTSPRRQVQLTDDEIRSAAGKKSSRISLHAAIIRFVRSPAFNEIQAELAEQAVHLASRERTGKHSGIATVSSPTAPQLATNPMIVFNRLPTDWWREQE